MQTNSMNRKWLYALLVGVYLLLPILILFGIIGFEYKFHVLCVGAIFVYIIMRLLGYANKDLGFTNSDFKIAIIDILPISITLSVVSILIWIFNLSKFTPTESFAFYIFYIFISCPAQEFLYRGALEAVLKTKNISSVYRMVITAVLYSFVHIIYKDLFTMIGTFLIGLLWYRSYCKTYNIWGVSLSHVILGIATIMTGVID